MHLDLDERRRLFLERAVWGPFREARDAGGSREQALNAAGFALGRWIPGGVVARHEAEAAVEEAICAMVGPGLTLRDARYQARRGLQAGERKGQAEPWRYCWPEELDPYRACQGKRLPLVRSPAAALPRPVEPPPPRPPAAEVLALWSAALPPTAATPEAEACATWLRSRGLDPAEVARLELARALPPAAGEVDEEALEVARERAAIAGEQGTPPELARALALEAARRAYPAALLYPMPALPSWAGMGRSSWRDTKHLLVLPAWAAAGELESLRARFVLPGEPARGAKAIGAAAGDGSGRGLVLANGPALALLRRRWSGELPPVVIAEGEPDFLAACCRRPELPILGVFSGSWTAEHAARIPDGARVTVWTHNDEAGAHYAACIQESLAGRRVNLARGRWPR